MYNKNNRVSKYSSSHVFEHQLLKLPAYIRISIMIPIACGFFFKLEYLKNALNRAIVTAKTDKNQKGVPVLPCSISQKII